MKKILNNLIKIGESLKGIFYFCCFIAMVLAFGSLIYFIGKFIFSGVLVFSITLLLCIIGFVMFIIAISPRM